MDARRRVAEALRGRSTAETAEDLVRAERAVESLSGLASGIELIDHRDLDYCVRPRDELGELQHQVYRTRGFSETARSLTPRSRVSAAQSDTATGFYYGSSVFLEYQSHRFIFGSDGSVTYHRDSFDVDCQKLPSPTLDLHGVEDIAQNEAPLAELLWLDQGLAGTRPEDWCVVSRIHAVGC